MSQCEHGCATTSCLVCKIKEARRDSHSGTPYRYPTYDDDLYKYRRYDENRPWQSDPPASANEVRRLEREVQSLRDQVQKLQTCIDRLMGLFLPDSPSTPK